MFPEAIYHSTDSEYCHAIDEKTILLRLRAKKGDLSRCVVCYADRYPRENDLVTHVNMDKVASDSLFDYFEAEINTGFERICYYFILYDGKSSVFYDSSGFHEHPNTNRTLYFQIPCIRKEDIADVPEWAKRAIMYQIFPDSFASSKAHISGKSIEVPVSEGVFVRNRLGGNLRGIIENLPYIEELGVNCIYLTPIFTASSYHKYDTVDYYSVDPCFGDNDTLKELVSKCHRSGIRVILDGVFNHSGSDFFAFRDVLEKGEKSRYKDWYFIDDFPVRYDDNPNYKCFAHVKFMPKLNTGNPEVIEYFAKVGTYWIKEADIDGWRLDVANEVDHNFWREFRKAVRSVKPDALLLGEIWHDAREWLQGDQFDSAMNYMFTYACIDFFIKRNINVEQFDARIQNLRMRYKKDIQYAQMNLLDSHDVSRFLSLAGGDVRIQKIAALFMMTHIGIPSIFYGDEKGIEGISEDEYRRPMIWEDTELSKDIFNYYKKLISIRKKYMDVMLGDYVTREVDILKNVYVYSREAGDKKLFIIINNSEYPVRVDVEVGDSLSSVNELLHDRAYTVVDSKVSLELDAISGAILDV